MNDAGRKFWLRIKKLLKENKFENVKGDEAFYIKKEGDKVEGMLVLHVDNFLMAGSSKFTTNMLKDNLTVSKIEDNDFRFVGIDMKLADNKIVVNMEEYVKSLEEAPVRPAKKKGHFQFI